MVCKCRIHFPKVCFPVHFLIRSSLRGRNQERGDRLTLYLPLCARDAFLPSVSLLRFPCGKKSSQRKLTLSGEIARLEEFSSPSTPRHQMTAASPAAFCQGKHDLSTCCFQYGLKHFIGKNIILFRDREMYNQTLLQSNDWTMLMMEAVARVWLVWRPALGTP